MSSGGCCVGCGPALKISNKFYAPEEFLREKAKKYYSDYPIASRIIGVLPMAIIGAVKPFIFTAWAVVGVVALPIAAAVRKGQGEIKEGDFLQHKASDYLKAWSFSILAVGGVVSFLALAGFGFPLVVTGGLLVTAIVVSIVIHVYRAFKEPESPGVIYVTPQN